MNYISNPSIGLCCGLGESDRKQSSIATMSGLTKQQLCDIVKKRRRLEANEMVSICRAMGITPNDLFKAIQSSA